jgi:hypothetical protein
MHLGHYVCQNQYERRGGATKPSVHSEKLRQVSQVLSEAHVSRFALAFLAIKFAHLKPVKREIGSTIIAFPKPASLLQSASDASKAKVLLGVSEIPKLACH